MMCPQARVRREAEKAARREAAEASWGHDSPWAARERAIQEAQVAQLAMVKLQQVRDAEYISAVSRMAADRAAQRRSELDIAVNAWAARRQQAAVSAANAPGVSIDNERLASNMEGCDNCASVRIESERSHAGDQSHGQFIPVTSANDVHNESSDSHALESRVDLLARPMERYNLSGIESALGRRSHASNRPRALGPAWFGLAYNDLHTFS